MNKDVISVGTGLDRMVPRPAIRQTDRAVLLKRRNCLGISATKPPLSPAVQDSTTDFLNLQLFGESLCGDDENLGSERVCLL